MCFDWQVCHYPLALGVGGAELDGIFGRDVHVHVIFVIRHFASYPGLEKLNKIEAKFRLSMARKKVRKCCCSPGIRLDRSPYASRAGARKEVRGRKIMGSALRRRSVDDIASWTTRSVVSNGSSPPTNVGAALDKTALALALVGIGHILKK